MLDPYFLGFPKMAWEARSSQLCSQCGRVRPGGHVGEAQLLGVCCREASIAVKELEFKYHSQESLSSGIYRSI